MDVFVYLTDILDTQLVRYLMDVWVLLLGCNYWKGIEYLFTGSQFIHLIFFFSFLAQLREGAKLISLPQTEVVNTSAITAIRNVTFGGSVLQMKRYWKGRERGRDLTPNEAEKPFCSSSITPPPPLQPPSPRRNTAPRATKEKQAAWNVAELAVARADTKVAFVSRWSVAMPTLCTPEGTWAFRPPSAPLRHLNKGSL